jgi:hypothetical protein
VGTFAWANETGGQLKTLPDRFVLLLGQAPLTQVERLLGGLRRPLGGARLADQAPRSVPSAEELISASPISRKAAELCETVGPEWLRDHCYRTYEIGALMGSALSIDPEVLFVACMLHDVGLTDDYKRGSDPAHVPGYERMDAPCFAVRGAGVAESLATFHGWPPGRSSALAEAISLHLNVRVARSRGVEAHLLNAASAFDVIRLRFHRLSRESVLRIESRWPRHESFCQDISTAWLSESKAHSECRGAFLDRWMCFQRRIHKTCPPAKSSTNA